MGHRFQNGQMNLPDAEYLRGCNFDPLPYFLTGDEIFSLKTWLMRPVPGKLSSAEQVLNYRVSTARRVIENTFGILVARWRLYRTPIIASVGGTRRVMLLQTWIYIITSGSLTMRSTHQKASLTQKIQLEMLQ